MVDQGGYSAARLQAATVKGYCIDAGLRVVDRSMQVLGGRGLATDDYPFGDFHAHLRRGRDADSAPVPIIEHPDVRRMLLAQKSFAEGALALTLYCAKLVDLVDTTADTAEKDRLELLLGVLTPIAKSWPSQWGLAANDLAIQVHGGYGYTRDYNVEQLYRDNRLNMIHEGTHGIQALDLLGRKAVLSGGEGLRLLTGRMRDTVTSAPGGAARELATALEPWIARVEDTARAAWAPGDPLLALANATAYLEAVGHVVVAWMWLEQVTAAEAKKSALAPGKVAAARYFYTYELPKAAVSFDLAASGDRLTIDLDTGVL
jgi:hypothetical protein